MKAISSKTTVVELASLISEHLRSRGIQATLVGGAVVTIYSDNEYQSRDLDFISPNENKQLTKAMAEIGFRRKGKDFHHTKTSFTVEFPTGPIAIGNEIPVTAEGVLKTPFGVVKLLSPTQCVMDRLAWFYHYNDRQCLDQAVTVSKKQDINLDKIRNWSEREGALDKFEIFLAKVSS